jgi:hypothetical protein
MSTAPNPAYKYQLGGSLERDSPTYVVRQADEEFYQAMKAGEFCYVLNSRQMGKSSLRVQTMQRLQTDGIACGVIDITSIGSHDIAPAEWYLGLVRRLARSFGTKVKVLKWWQEREGLSPVQRLGEFIEEVLLTEIHQNIVIFIDEIDSVLRLGFKDDFFALIRACYNQRADNPEYQRLTFALLGVTTPSDLIQDKTRTPFNIGSAIELCGFQLHEVQPLAQGLEEKVDNPQEVLREILAWTGGQPFLTQKLCQLVLSSPFTIAAGSEAELIEGLVRARIIENWESTDEPEHLKTIRDRLLKSSQQPEQLLQLYQLILQQGEIDANTDRETMNLRLTGLVVKQQSKLKVYNRIYASVFNPAWAENESFKLPVAQTSLGQAQLEYKKEVERCIQWGMYSTNSMALNQDIYILPERLIQLRRKLRLLPEVARVIENEVLESYWNYRTKLQKYQEVLVNQIKESCSLSNQAFSQLKELQQELGLTDEDIQPNLNIILQSPLIPIEQDLYLRATIDLNFNIILMDLVEERVKKIYTESYGSLHLDFQDIASFFLNSALSQIDSSDAPFHNVEYTIYVTLVGLELLRAKHFLEGGVSPEDWLHFAISLVCQDIGYVKGVCRGDRLSERLYATSREYERVCLPPGATAASLEPYHVDRAKIFIEERFDGHILIDAEVIKRNIELTRFPVPEDEDHQDTLNYPGLLRAATLIAEYSNPRCLKKISALFHEYEESGLNQSLGYHHLDELRKDYLNRYRNQVFPFIQGALRYLSLTSQGRQITTSLHANLFVMEHSMTRSEFMSDEIQNEFKGFQPGLDLTSKDIELIETQINFKDATTVLIKYFDELIQRNYTEVYGRWKSDYREIAGWAGNLAVSFIDSSDALFHDVEYTIFVTLVGLELLRGKHLREGGVSPEDWLLFAISLACQDIGYIKGICQQDRPDEELYATGIGEQMVALPPGATDASLEPYHVDRAKLFIEERFGGHRVIDAEVIKHNIELTRFPVPKDEDHQDRISYPGLLRAATLIAEYSNPRCLKKISALFHEYGESGLNQTLGYHHLDELRKDYLNRYWNQVFPFIKEALKYLSLTPQGRQITTSLYANLFVMEHSMNRSDFMSDEIQSELKTFQLGLSLSFKEITLIEARISSQAPSYLDNLNRPTILKKQLETRIKEVYKDMYGGYKNEYIDIAISMVNVAFNHLDNSDALFHNLEHTIYVTLVGVEILYGKFILQYEISREDWLHFVISLVFQNIGYVRGICRQDKREESLYAAGKGDELISLPLEATDASLEPYHVDRAKLFIDERFGDDKLIDAEVIKHYIERTRFPVPAGESYIDTVYYPGLLRAADIIGEFGDPRYLNKVSALFYEYEETGLNQSLGYRNLNDLRKDYPNRFWNDAFPYIQEALRLLAQTTLGKQYIANLYSNVFRSTHSNLS